MNARGACIVLSAIAFQSCVERDINDNVGCQGIELSLDGKTEPSSCLQADGSIQVSAKHGREPYTFKLGLLPVANGNLTDLEAGTHQITVTDYSGCSDTLLVTLQAPVVQNLSWFSHVRPIFESRCVKCHTGGGKGDFRNYPEVIEYIEKIRHRVITRSMPQDSPLEKDKIRLIVCWIDSGAREF